MSIAPALATIPEEFTMAVVETWTLGFNTSGPLTEGSPPTDAVVTLTEVVTGWIVTLPDPPSINGNFITQILRGSSLEAQHQYTLGVSYTVTEATIPYMELLIIVPQ